MRPKNPSTEQLAIWKEVKEGKSNVCVEATAGAGKTTTLLGCLDEVPRFKKSAFFSFSKAIVEELKPRVPSHIPAMTLHARGLKFIYNHYRDYHLQIEDKKYEKIAMKTFLPKSGAKKEHFRECYMIADLCNYARMTLTPLFTEDLMEMAGYYNIEATPLTTAKAIRLLNDSLDIKPKGMIDFVDMIYLPVMVPNMINEQYDFIFLDEAQDTNKCQLELIEKLIKPSGRLIAVGDKNQSIYSFSGADIESFQKIQSRPNTVTLPLDVSYRCSKAAVEKARKVYESIRPFDGANDGVDRKGSWTEIEEGDMVVSRTTRPLIALYFKLIETDIKATIVGKDIEQGLIRLAERCESETKDGVVYQLKMRLKELYDELSEYGYNEQTIYADKKYIALEEKIQVIILILQKIASPKLLVNKIKEIFREDKKACRLMTIHRSKGLESERVFIIEKFNNKKLMPSEYAVQAWEKVQESNLEFVAYTRAKSDIISLDLSEM